MSGREDGVGRADATDPTPDHGQTATGRPEPVRSGGIPLPMVTPEAQASKDAPPMDRREALKLLALAAAAGGTGSLSACAPGDEPAAAGGSAGMGVTPGAGGAATNPKARGDAWDPDLVAPQLRWEKVLTEDELESLAVLVDVIIPADDVSPSASDVGAHHYIDEWVSAPYDFGRQDLLLVRGGLVWLDQESSRRFGTIKRFRHLLPEEKVELCDDICFLPDARPEYEFGARFFDKVRDLTTTAFYTTEEGMADIGYVGNVPQTTWGPPPPEVLRHLGLE